uniref:Uncharacterized protein n=1 Tax=Oryza brachyantha TaxID=4533 RepID=J3N5R4_ORYBR
MVHQFTGADDLPPPPPALSPPTELVRPVRAPLMLPTLDTSAFLLGGEARPADGGRGRDVSLALVGGAAPHYNTSNSNSKNGFPTLDSWDLL